jgi:hypothetical protein
VIAVIASAARQSRRTAFSDQLSAISSQQSAISFQLSATSWIATSLRASR